MQQLYNFAVGPLAWVAWAVFLGGAAWRLGSMWALARKKDMNAVAYMDVRFAARSMARWATPFATLGWRANPAVTVATFAFHTALGLLLLFAPGHAVLWDYAFGVNVWSLPEGVADVLTVLVILLCGFFAWRRLQLPTVRFVTRPMDWLVLALVAVPCITAFLAKQQIGDNLLLSTLHVLSGEAMLMALPFTRLSHAIFSPFTRAYMGSEFGGVRHCPDW